MKPFTRIFYIVGIVIISCVIMFANAYLESIFIIRDNRLASNQALYFLYFFSIIVFIKVFKNLKPNHLILLLFLPVAFLSIFGICVNPYSFPYIYPLQTINALFALILGKQALQFKQPAFLKQAAICLAGALVLFAFCWNLFKKDFIDNSRMRTIAFKETQNQKDIFQIENELVDTLGNHFVFDNKKYYILDFSYRDCRPCRIKLDFLKRFSKESPSNLQIVYISPSIAETYKYFKDNLTHEKDDKIIYAYLDDNELLKKMGITIFPREIFIGSDLKILRFEDGFQQSDESFYKENTLKLINNAQ